VPSEAQALRAVVLERGLELGFHRVGVASFGPRSAHYQRYLRWLERGQHGSMDYMARPEHREARRDAQRILPNTRSVVVAALAYDPGESDRLAPETAFVARYARGQDYHQVMRERLDALGRSLQMSAPGLTFRSCVDTAPVLERELAERAGLGFIGKNTLLISPGLGSYTVLGELFVDRDLATTEADAMGPRCGECTACIDACPTGAIVADGIVDARRCISYLTIENRKQIPADYHRAMENMVFGCDRCQEVCPYNSRAPHRVRAEPRLTGPPSADSLVSLASLGSGAFRRKVKDSAMARVSRPRFLRNVAIALGNSPAPDATPALEKLQTDGNPLVAEAAEGALRQRSS
jgi:epoxyqueuosine reductase